jgi:hypothetical protein
LEHRELGEPPHLLQRPVLQWLVRLDLKSLAPSPPLLLSLLILEVEPLPVTMVSMAQLPVPTQPLDLVPVPPPVDLVVPAPLQPDPLSQPIDPVLQIAPLHSAPSHQSPFLPVLRS